MVSSLVNIDYFWFQVVQIMLLGFSRLGRYISLVVLGLVNICPLYHHAGIIWIHVA